MIEEHWLATNTPLEMIGYLAQRVSERKLRLFACEQILTHLRDGGEHYRGCWVIDLLLGKQ